MKYFIPILFIAFLFISQIGCKSDSTTGPNTGGVSFAVKYFVNGTSDTVFFYGIPNVNIKLDSIRAKYPDAQTFLITGNGATWKNTDSLIFDYYNPSVTGTYNFIFYGKTESNSTTFNVPVNRAYP